jgi:hypothetical protein
MNPKQQQAQGPIVAEGIAQKLNLSVRLTGPEDRQVIRCIQEAKNGHQV